MVVDVDVSEDVDSRGSDEQTSRTTRRSGPHALVHWRPGRTRALLVGAGMVVATVVALSAVLGGGDDGSNRTGCFPAGELVALADGTSVPIERLVPGQHVTLQGGLVIALMKLAMPTSGPDSSLYRSVAPHHLPCVHHFGLHRCPSHRADLLTCQCTWWLTLASKIPHWLATCVCVSIKPTINICSTCM
jgi:hypothetical protein